MLEVMPSRESESRSRVAQFKLLPEIDLDACRGCGKCVKACPSASLEMEWFHAVLVRPGDCTSQGNCVDACPHGGIEMQWMAATGDPEAGCWREEPPKRVPVAAPVPAPSRPGFWPLNLFVRSR